MKYLPLLLLLSGTCFAEGPYVVISSQGKDYKAFCVSQNEEIFWCNGSNERMEDLAFALNEAHERRTNRFKDDPSTKGMKFQVSPHTVSGFNYPKACGGSCGEDGK